MNLSITNASVSEIQALLSLFSSNVEKLTSTIDTPKVNVSVSTKDIAKSLADIIESEYPKLTYSECEEKREIQDDIIVNGLEENILNDPDFTEIKPVTGSEDQLEQLHLDPIQTEESKSFSKNEIFKLATELSNKGGQAKLVALLKEYKVQALPQLEEKDFNSFGLKLSECVKEVA